MGTHQILVAEDEQDIRDLITFTLELSGYEVIHVTNGQAAIETAKDIMPDLIILDVRMPKMTGYEVCEALKHDELTKNIPVIFLSAKGQEAEVKHGKSLGAEAYFVKPFVPDELTENVKSILMKYNKV